jgi:hypothetical protein
MALGQIAEKRHPIDLEQRLAGRRQPARKRFKIAAIGGQAVLAQAFFHPDRIEILLKHLPVFRRRRHHRTPHAGGRLDSGADDKFAIGRQGTTNQGITNKKARAASRPGFLR